MDVEHERVSVGRSTEKMPQCGRWELGERGRQRGCGSAFIAREAQLSLIELTRSRQLDEAQLSLIETTTTRQPTAACWPAASETVGGASRSSICPDKS